MFSKSTEYALRAAIFIAQKSSATDRVSIQAIADAISAPRSFTAKILQQLTQVNYGIIASATGPGGGFYIDDSKRTMPVRKILEAMGESVVLDKCVLGLAMCSDEKPCPIHRGYKPIRQQIIRLFEKKTIEELAQEYSYTGVIGNGAGGSERRDDAADI